MKSCQYGLWQNQHCAQPQPGGWLTRVGDGPSTLLHNTGTRLWLQDRQILFFPMAAAVASCSAVAGMTYIGHTTCQSWNERILQAHTASTSYHVLVKSRCSFKNGSNRKARLSFARVRTSSASSVTAPDQHAGGPSMVGESNGDFGREQEGGNVATPVMESDASQLFVWAEHWYPAGESMQYFRSF